jgi:cell division protein FtsL
MFKKLLVIVIIIVALIILVGLIRQIYAALGSDKRFNQVLEDVNKLERDNKDLKRELAQAESLNSVEEIARDDLNMSLPNETIVVVPEDVIDRVVNPPPPYTPPKPANWEGWLRLFIYEPKSS